MNHPLVSIIIPVYNGSNYLREAIDSAIAQTYKNIEIIVVNDGSDDDGATEAIAKSYGKKIKYYLKKNGGVATALNYGIKKMTGYYFSWLSHDDMYEKKKIELQVDRLRSEQKKEDLIVACNAKILYENGLKQNEYIDARLFEFFDVFLSISADVGVNGCSLLIPRKALLDVGGFNKSLPVTQDYDLWFRLSKKCEFVLIEKNLVISRRHGSQDSIKKQKICFYASDKLHYDFLRQITSEKFSACIDYVGMDKIWSKYVLYRNNGYAKTASVILKYVLDYYKKNDFKKYEKIISEEIGEFINIVDDCNKKKILFFNNVWTKGGISKILNYIFNSLSIQYSIFLITPNDSDYCEGTPLSPDISYIKINQQNQNGRIINALVFFDIDVFVGNPNFSQSFLDIYLLAKDLKTKVLAYNHGHYLLPYMYPHLYPVALSIKEAYSAVDGVIWLSSTANEIYNMQNSNGIYLPNPVELNVGVQPRNCFQKRLLSIGRFDDEIKRIDRILLIFKEILKIDSGFHLDIVGPCPMDFILSSQNNVSIGDFLKSLKIPDDKIKFWGDQSDVSPFYKRSDVLLMPSDCEGFGLVYTEALSYGLPCACSNYSGIEEIVQDNYNGWLSKDDIYLAKKIVDVGHNKQQYNEFSRNALNSIKKYDKSKFEKRWIDLIETLISSGSIELYQKNEHSRDLFIFDYKKAISEYESILNTVIKNNFNNSISNQVLSSGASDKKYKDWIRRLLLSFKRHGFWHTFKKMINKFYKKSISIINK